MKKSFIYSMMVAVLCLFATLASAQENKDRKTETTEPNRNTTATFKGTGFGDPARSGGTRGMNKAPKAPQSPEKQANPEEKEKTPKEVEEKKIEVQPANKEEEKKNIQ